jgi:hypothetical protein
MKALCKKSLLSPIDGENKSKIEPHFPIKIGRGGVRNLSL